MIDENTLSALNMAIEDIQEILTRYAFSEKLLDNSSTTFGDRQDYDVAEDVVTQWQIVVNEEK